MEQVLAKGVKLDATVAYRGSIDCPPIKVTHITGQQTIEIPYGALWLKTDQGTVRIYIPMVELSVIMLKQKEESKKAEQAMNPLKVVVALAFRDDEAWFGNIDEMPSAA